MNIEISRQQEITIIKLTGELHRQTVPGIQEQITPLAAPHCKILLDMSGVTYMSSAGLRLLLLFYRKIEGVQGKIVITGLQELVHDTMSITGFLEFFTAYDTVKEGLDALNA